MPLLVVGQATAGTSTGTSAKPVPLAPTVGIGAATDRAQPGMIKAMQRDLKLTRELAHQPAGLGQHGLRLRPWLWGDDVALDPGEDFMSGVVETVAHDARAGIEADVLQVAKKSVVGPGPRCDATHDAIADPMDRHRLAEIARIPTVDLGHHAMMTGENK